jgi:hypothetical protein
MARHYELETPTMKNKRDPVSVDIDKLAPTQRHIFPERLKKYAVLDPVTCPPIQVRGNRVTNGHHRWEVAKLRGDKTIKAVGQINSDIVVKES